MKKELNKSQTEEIKNLSAMSDDEIDYSDIPPVIDLGGYVVGKFYRPIKQPVTIRLDADVLAFFKSKGKGYQTVINTVLKRYVQAQAH